MLLTDIPLGLAVLGKHRSLIPLAGFLPVVATPAQSQVLEAIVRATSLWYETGGDLPAVQRLPRLA